MARAATFLAGVALGLAIGTAVVVSHADPQSPDVVEAAAEAGVDPQDLAAAVATVGGTDPRSYLRSVGELPPLPPPPAVVVGPWTALAHCESADNWHIVTRAYFPDGTPATYYGGLQEDAQFWANHGGLAYADRPDHATPAEQMQVAINGRDGLVGVAQGYAAWPTCSRRLGLR